MLSGEIVAINDAVVDNPEIVNSDPLEEGWLLKVRLNDPGEVDQLLDAVREAASPRAWGAAVQLVRDGAVKGVSDDGEDGFLFSHICYPKSNSKSHR